MDGFNINTQEKIESRAAHLSKLLSRLVESDGYVVILLTSDANTTGGFTTELRTDIPKDSVPELLQFITDQMK